MVGENDKAEFLGQIIDVFEDFLAEKRIAPFNNKPQEDNDPNNPVYKRKFCLRMKLFC